MAIKILITDGMAKEGVEILKKHPEFEVDLRKETPLPELQNIIGNYDAIVIRSATRLTRELIDRCTNMKLIVRAGAGVDNIDVPAATEKKIPVMNTASANSLAAAEQTIALMFAVLRQIPQAAQSLRDGKWERDKFKGYEATGKTIGVVGCGNIGRIVAEKAIGLGMKVIGFDPVSKGPFPFPMASSIDELLPKVDLVTFHIPKTKETTNMLNASRLATMKPTAFVLNCARGGIVDEKALLAALDAGKLAGAALDVFEKEPAEFPNPLFTHAKVVAAPHLGASTFEAQERVALTAADQMVGFFKRGDRTGILN